MKKLMLMMAACALFSLGGAELEELFKYTPKNADSVLVVRADRLPAAVTECEDARKAAAEGLDIKNITGLVLPFRSAGDDMYIGALVGVKDGLQLFPLLDKAKIEHRKMRIANREAVKVTHNGKDLFIIDFAPGVLLFANDEASAKPFFTAADPARGAALAKLCPDPEALVWGGLEVPAPAAGDAQAQQRDFGIRRVTALCRVKQTENKLDTFLKAVLACKDGESAAKWAQVVQTIVMPVLAEHFGGDQALAEAVKSSIGRQVSGNVLEVTMTIPHDLAVRIGKYGKAQAEAKVKASSDAGAKSEKSAPAAAK